MKTFTIALLLFASTASYAKDPKKLFSNYYSGNEKKNTFVCSFRYESDSPQKIKGMKQFNIDAKDKVDALKLCLIRGEMRPSPFTEKPQLESTSEELFNQHVPEISHIAIAENDKDNGLTSTPALETLQNAGLKAYTCEINYESFGAIKPSVFASAADDARKLCVLKAQFEQDIKIEDILNIQTRESVNVKPVIPKDVKIEFESVPTLKQLDK